jgi:hypothetical protein
MASVGPRTSDRVSEPSRAFVSQPQQHVTVAGKRRAPARDAGDNRRGPLWRIARLRFSARSAFQNHTRAPRRALTGADMPYPQSTLEEIVDSERAMFVDAAARYGQHYTHARDTTMLLSNCIVRIEKKDRSRIFGRLFSLMKKQHTLAFLSTLRLHRVQAMMNLRQVLEAGGAAAYAIANPKLEDFVDIDAFGIMDPSQKLTRKRYRWLDEKYPLASERIKKAKDDLNTFSTHANVVTGDSTFSDVGHGVSLPFFDREDDYSVKIDLWLISNLANSLMDLFYSVANDVVTATGQSVVGFHPDFLQIIQRLVDDERALNDELQATNRFKAVKLKIDQREEANPKTYNG